MAIRGVFVPKDTYPYVEEVPVEFDWFGGFAVAQKQRCATSLHLTFLARNTGAKPIEISGASGYSLGQKLSAMNLRKWSRTANSYVCLESAFQSSRIYVTSDNNRIGPLTQYLKSDGKVAKSAVKKASQGIICSEYLFDGMRFPVPDFHISLFYDYLYLNALLEDANRDVALQLLTGGFNAFSDLATKALNTQARSCALFVSLSRLGLIDRVRDYNAFMELFRVDLTRNDYAAPGAYNGAQVLFPKHPLGVKCFSAIVPWHFTKDEVIRHHNACKGIVTMDNIHLAKQMGGYY